eukprot:m.80652 g.80652  ORF g.80652 m.80652 type:complete len:538 (+) comp8628_c0_seq2:16-1629(+)
MSSGQTYRATLRPVKALRNKNVPPFSLKHGVTILGRSRQTRIKYQECSRSQIELQFTHDGEVSFRQIGANQSAVNGNPTARDEKITLRNGSKISFLAMHPDTTSFVLDLEEIAVESLAATQSIDTLNNDSEGGPSSSSPRTKKHVPSSSPLATTVIKEDKHSLKLSPSNKEMNQQIQSKEVVDQTEMTPTPAKTLTTIGMQKKFGKTTGMPFLKPPILITSESVDGRKSKKIEVNSKKEKVNGNAKGEEDDEEPASVDTGHMHHSIGSYEPVTSLLKHHRKKRRSSSSDEEEEEEKEIGIIKKAQVIEEEREELECKKPRHVNAFDIMLHASKEEAKAPPRSPKGSRWHENNRMDWSSALVHIVEHPELHKQDIVFQNDKVIIINDKYPKARYHFLVMPREVIEDIYHLTPDHLNIIKDMQICAMEFGKKIRMSKKGISFRTGFHAVPSMRQLHLHLISQDFDSACLKNKKHWNSFNTDYFVPPKKLHHRLQKYNHVDFDETTYKELLKRPLQCHLCREQYRTIPALKQHLADHSAS